ncbi:MFS transporter [Thermoflavimicrobium daqui]|uniref:Major facilitator superfamily (MFS) profile domain-containing protein n=1 Tax=Thermoflavimicrobium daqui TaxID=2137476 RepID=A0A364K6T4_9BACL|nr:MFS transporter [Thermoflavimicrobium daqui]RAL26004.1 hypothetical protein DL897_08045 [Thermoflavimicrobium daqui]
MVNVKKFSMMSSTIAIYLSALDMVVLIPALNWINREFMLSIRWGVWAVAIYLISFAVALPLMERWASLVGRRKEMGYALLFFSSGAVLSAVSHNWLLFLFGRGLQAFGASGMVPFLSQRFYRLFHISRTKGFRLIWIALLILTPIFSVTWISLLGWRSFFLLYLLLAFFLFFLLNKWLPQKMMGTRHTSFSWGTPIFGLIVILLMLAMTRIYLPLGFRAWIHPRVLPLLILALGLIVILFMVERKKRYPFFEPHLFGKPYLWLLYIIIMMTGFSWAILVLLPWWFTHFFHQHDLWYGGILALILAASVVTVWVTQKWVEQISFSVIAGCGFICAAVSYILLFWIQNMWLILLLFVLLGIGMGLTISAPVHHVLFRMVEPERWRSGLTVLGMFRAAGGSLGLVVMAQLLNVWEPGLSRWYDPNYPVNPSLDIAFGYMFNLAAQSAVIGVILSFFLWWRGKRGYLQ